MKIGNFPLYFHLITNNQLYYYNIKHNNKYYDSEKPTTITLVLDGKLIKFQFQAYNVYAFVMKGKTFLIMKNRKNSEHKKLVKLQ